MARPDTETVRIVRAVLRWQRLRAPHLLPHLSRIPSDADADHSALLQRLLAGHEPFPTPPPTAYSYPWYSLVEKGWAIAGCEFWHSQPQEYEHSPGWLHFQQSAWHIQSRGQANGYPCWTILHPNGWHASVAWEEGPFVVGRTMVPAPHDILQPAYIVRLAADPLLVEPPSA